MVNIKICINKCVMNLRFILEATLHYKIVFEFRSVCAKRVFIERTMQFVNNNVSLVNYISCQCRWPHGSSSPLMQYTRSRAPGPGGKVTSTSRGWRWVGLGICKVGEVGSVILDTISPTGSHVLQSLLPTSLPVDLYGPLFIYKKNYISVTG